LSASPVDPGVLFLSDRGCQYASGDFVNILAAHGFEPSMSRRGNCWDNAVTESFFNSLKNGRVQARYATCAEGRQDVFEYIELFYNRIRRHSALGYRSPADFHSAWLDQQTKLAA
jgi:putative transposase